MRVLGLGLIIIILQFLVPRIFHSVEETIVTTLNTAQVLVSASGKALGEAVLPNLK